MNLSVMIKPASGLCNLRCRYCFYRDLTEQREVASYGIMQAETLRLLLLRAFESLPDKRSTLSLIFQGGEPMLAGIDFFRQLECLLDEMKPAGVRVERSIQTNGTLINDEWAEHFAKYRYLVGVSLDGPADIQNELRPDANGKGSFNAVVNGINCLKKHRVEYNILTVVTAKNARHGRKLYTFLRKNGWSYLQFIPCMDPLDGASREYSLKAEQYGQFLIDTFTLYEEEILRGQNISVRWFDNLLTMAAGYPPESCGMTGVCTCSFVVEADGSVYPCDFYVDDAHRLGNLRDVNFRMMFESDTAERFMKESCVQAEKCRSCRWYALCRGGCRRYRMAEEENAVGLNRLCGAYEMFFDACGTRLLRLAGMLAGSR